MFIYKEIKEILQCKKIILYIIFSIIYPSILNLIANNPIVPLENLLKMSLIFTAEVSMEIIYVTMSEEIQKGTFDILLLSDMSRLKIVIFKNILPSLSGIAVVFLGIGVNNLLSLMIEKFILIRDIDGLDVILWISVSMIGSLTGFLITIKRNAKHSVITGTLFIIFMFFSALSVLEKILNAYGFIAMCFLLVIAMLNYVLTVMKQQRFNKMEVESKIHFSDEDDSVEKSLWKRDIMRCFLRKRVFVKICFFLGSILLFLMQKKVQGIEQGLILLLLFVYEMVWVMDVVFDTIKLEKYSNMQEILQIANIGLKQNYNVFVHRMMYMSVIITLIFMIIPIVLIQDIIGIRYIVLYSISVIINCNICKYVVIKHLEGIKHERVVRLLIYILSLIVFLLSSILIIQ